MLPPVTEMIVILGTHEERGEELITVAEKSFGTLLGAAAPQRDALGRLSFTRGELTLLADQRDGLFVVSTALGDAERASQNLEAALRGASKRPAARVDSELGGQLQFVLSPAFGARLAPALRSIGSRWQEHMAESEVPLPLPVAMLLSGRQRQDSFAKLAKGFGIALLASDDGLRLRLRQ